MSRKKGTKNYSFDYETAKEFGELQESKTENFVRRVVGRRKTCYEKSIG